VSDDFSFAFGQSSYCGDGAPHSFACGENAGCEGAVSFAAVRSPYVSAPNGDVSLQQMLDGFAGFRRLFRDESTISHIS
jgi:hypothetical protein